MAHWGYGRENGPHTWGDHWPIGRHPIHGQSPVDIEPENTTKPEGWRRIKLKFRPERCERLHNNGHSVQVDVAPPSGERGHNLQYGPLSDDFTLAQFHFHWGKDDSEGSEHTVDGSSYAAEAHFVHYNMTQYGDVNEAIDKYKGIAVLGVLLQVGEENKGLQKLVDLFDHIQYKGDDVQLENGFNPKWLLPQRKDRQKYWHYYGSLTTPPLHESVNWFVFQKPVEISSEQLEAFRRLHSHAQHSSPDPNDEFGGHIECNFRPPQPVNFERDGDEVCRTVYSHKVKSRPKPGQDPGYNADDSGDDAGSESQSSSESEDDN